MTKNHSIQTKLIRTFSTVIVCVILTTTIITGFYIYYTQSDDLLSSYKSIATNVSLQLEKELSDVENLARLLCSDTTLQRLMHSHLDVQGYPYYQTLREINSCMTRYVTMYDALVDDIYIIDREDTILSRNAYYDDTLTSSWFQEYLAQSASLYYTRPYQASRRVSGGPADDSTLVSCIVRMYDLQALPAQDRFLGYVIINMKYDTLVAMLNDFPDLDCTLVDAAGHRLDGSAAMPEPVTRWIVSEKSSNLRSGGYYYIKSPLAIGSWTLVIAARFSMFYIRIRDALLFLVLMTVLVAVSARCIIIVLSRSITEPLKLLTQGIRQFSVGDMQTRVDIRSGDEVEEIASVFNDMVQRINRQMEQNLCKENEKRRSEMRFLMAQIKPHFIYNSLNCIIYLARGKKFDEIISYTRAFISLLQDAIRTQPQQMVPIGQEVRSLENYVSLLRYRYDNAPALTCEIAPDCAETCLPGLILLPIVENSVFHGLLPLDSPGGRIDLIVRREDGRVCICIRDNGCGMSPEAVETLRASLRSKREGLAKEEHIGLTNINERLKLCSCMDGDLHLESAPGQGMAVWFYLHHEEQLP